MYRGYENPYELEEQLKELKKDYQAAVEENADEEIIINIGCDIEELKERINFAWQDNEYDEYY